MSALFGPFIQQGWIVPDLDAALAHWLGLGVGPFFVEEHIRPPGEFDGQPIQADLTAAFAYSGDQQIELIQQNDDTPTIYREYLSSHPEGGLQHVACWVDDVPAKLDELASRAPGFRIRQRYGDAHVYLELPKLEPPAHPGPMVQLMARIELMTSLFDDIERACMSWDGHTDPVRKIDWSSGRPVIQG